MFQFFFYFNCKFTKRIQIRADLIIEVAADMIETIEIPEIIIEIIVIVTVELLMMVELLMIIDMAMITKDLITDMGTITKGEIIIQFKDVHQMRLTIKEEIIIQFKDVHQMRPNIKDVEIFMVVVEVVVVALAVETDEMMAHLDTIIMNLFIDNLVPKNSFFVSLT